MPGDRLPFAVRVGCQQDVVGFGGGLRDRVYMLAVARDGLVLHCEAVVGIDRAAFRHQVAHVAVGGQHLEVLAQIFLERLGLGRGFDNE